ncbi:MAG: pentapeptide repeat-containing protein [Phycisphaerales bacterium]
MREFFHTLKRMSDADYESLQPLVKKGKDRQEELESIVSKWLTPSAKAAELDGPREAIEAHVADGGFVLDGFAFVDENTNEPIDLGELLRLLEESLRADGAGEIFEPRPDLFVLIRHCRFDACDCRGVKVRPRLVAHHCRCGAGADFRHARFGYGASINFVEFGDGADFGAADFGDGTDFWRSEFGDGVSFWGAGFGDGASFFHAKFGDGASFRRAEFGDGASFFHAKFGDGADFGDAEFGDGANFRHARLKGADLRGTQGFIPGETLIRDAHFSARASDPWSKLRAAYTGPRLIFNLLFLALFFLPLLARTVGWTVIGAAEEEFVAALPELHEMTHELDEEHPQVAAWLRESLGEIERNAPGGAADRWRETRVIDPVLGWSQGLLFFIPACTLLLYNLGQGLLTYVVSPMRDAEERSGISPRYRARPWEKVQDHWASRNTRDQKKGVATRAASFGRRIREYLGGYFEAYGWLVPIHKAMNWLLLLAIVSFIVNAVNWLFFQDVWVLKV